MKKKIKDLELWDIYYFHRRKVVCVAKCGKQYYAPLEKQGSSFSHWEYDLEKKVTIIGKMRAGPTDEEIEKENKELHESWLNWCQEKGQWP